MIPMTDRLTLKLVVGLVAALALALLVHDRNRWKGIAALRQEQLVGEQSAHKGTVANYRAAAERARREDAENIDRVKADQAAINERTANDYEKRIAAARAASDRLRREAVARADPGSGRAAPVPGLSAAAGGASEAAGEDRLSGRLDSGDALIATEQAIQLDELIKWVRRQAAVATDASGE